jgi:AcrR family transcriptional regulator
MSKGAQTRERILERAFRIASRDGLEGMSLSALAAETGLSKSGLFAHFTSKEDLQVELLRRAAERFERVVWGPALRAPRGEPRLRALFDAWRAWDTDSPGGCIFVAAAAELDDREGAPRDFLVENQVRLHGSLARAAKIAIEEGHFRPDLDCEQFAFELYGILLANNHFHRLLRDPSAARRSQAAFERLLEAARAPS